MARSGAVDTRSNEFMKVQLAKLKAEQEKSGKKVEHKENFKKVASLWATA
jgi:hypothetical protein